MQMTEILKQFYMKAGVFNPTASTATRSFNSLTLTGEKTKICEKFRKRDFNIQILCATDTMGLGMNISDLEIIV